MDVVLKSNETEQKSLLYREEDSQIPDEKNTTIFLLQPHRDRANLYSVYGTSVTTSLFDVCVSRYGVGDLILFKNFTA